MSTAVVATPGTSVGTGNPIRTTATTVGVFFGLLSGVNHGIFEVLQGNVSTPGLVVDAIGPEQRFWVEGTEPALTLIPNFLFTGLASIVVGLAIAVWSVRYLGSSHGRSVFLGLFIASFLVGGGMGQAFFFIPAWAFATRMYSPLVWWRRVLSGRPRRVLSRMWAPLLVSAVVVMLAGLELAIFGYFPGITDPDALQNLAMVFVFGSAFLFVAAFVAAIARRLIELHPAESAVA